jgi:hypothetical protein
MIENRNSPDKKPNSTLRRKASSRKETNTRWLARIKMTQGLVLLGGSSLEHFRIRVAQSHLRHDFLPSYWSLAGILDGGKFISVPLGLHGDLSEIPKNNGIEDAKIQEYDDPIRFPNIAILRFPVSEDALQENIRHVRAQRSIVDLPNLILPWLGFVWGAGSARNPLQEGHGLPSAVFVEMVYGMARVELTPGLATAASCPEAIWQTAKWWTSYYRQASPDGKQTDTIPSGDYTIRQVSAAVVEDKTSKSRY